jgi:galactokinase/mevalonate kinase-like predicted kinase
LHIAVIEEIKHYAFDTYETMLNKYFEELGVEIDKSWQHNQKLDAGTNTNEIQWIIDRIKVLAGGTETAGCRWWWFYAYDGKG